jgi:hypothetical protein
MNPLESRKQLLIAESELNRSQLVVNLVALGTNVRTLADRAKSFGAIASSVITLVTVVTAFRPGDKAGKVGTKPGWLSTILKGASLISTLWLTLRPPSGDPKDK